jgi:hypothetical protein
LDHLLYPLAPKDYEVSDVHQEGFEQDLDEVEDQEGEHVFVPFFYAVVVP